MQLEQGARPMTTTNRLTISKVTPAYWRVIIENPPINLYDPEMFAELNVLMDRIEADRELKVVVFESANPDYFVAHYDLERGAVIPEQPGAAEFSAWPKFVTRLAQSRVVSVAKLRGRARGHGSELALACDTRFASKEKAVLAQTEVGGAVVPGGGATEWLCALAGRSRALEIICGANDFDADTAEKYGWVNRSIPDAELGWQPGGRGFRVSPAGDRRVAAHRDRRAGTLRRRAILTFAYTLPLKGPSVVSNVSVLPCRTARPQW